MSAAPTSNKAGQNGVANGNSSQDANCTLLVGISKNTTLSAKDVKDALENGDLVVRADALEQLIRMHLNGESQNHMIMTVIRYITPIDDHLIKKLLLYFWEVVDKTDEEGKLLSVMILICDFLRKDLIHPNEYIRGITLRFLSRLTNREIIEPLVSNILLNLTHRVAYVRRNAVLAIHSIYVKFPELLPDAIEHVEKYMVQENDVSALRNAFDMIAHFAPEHASQFLSHYFASHVIEEAGGGFLMSAVDFCQTRIAVDESNKAQYVPILFSILQSKNFAVRFQCANTLLSLSSSPTAIRQALLTFIQLLKTHSDNSVKLIVIDRLEWMRHRYLPSMQNAMKDVLSALQDGSLEVRSRIIGLAAHLITSQNVNVFVQAVRTELNQVQIEMNAAAESATLSAASSYKLKLIHAINTTIRRYPNVADGILPLLLDYICESVNTSTSANPSTMNSNPLTGSNTNTISGELSYSSSSSVHVAALIKETLQLQPSLRHTTLIKLHEVFQLISSSEVLRMVLWILGAYAERNDEIISTLELIQESMEPFPLAKNNTRNDNDDLTMNANGNETLSTQPEHGQASLNTSITTSTNTNTNNKSTNVKSASLPQPNVQVTTTVREDGTYATTYNTLPASTMNNNTSTTTSLGALGGNSNTNGSELTGLRAFIVNGQFFLASALASTLTKLIIRLHFNRHGSSAHNSSTTNINNNKNVKTNINVLSDDRTLTSEEIAHWTRVSTDMLNEVLRYGISYSSSTTTIPSTHDADGNANAESETIMPLMKVGMDEDTHTHLRLALSILSRPEKYFCMRYLEYSTRAVEHEQVTFASHSHFPASHTKIKGSVASIQKENAQQHAKSINNNKDDYETRYAHIKHMNFTKPISFSLLEGDMMPSLSDANNNNSRYPSYYEDAEDSYDTANHTNYMNGFYNTSATANNLMGIKSERVATGFGAGSSDNDEYSFLRELEKVVPYSGCDDEVYCEASISLKHFDVSINWSLTNTTATPFKNVCIELASLGGMKLFERPKYYDLPANSTIKIRTSLKASAAETGVVFAALIYESEFKPTEHKSNNAGMGREFAPEEIRTSPSFQLGGNVINYVPLMDVHIDIMNYVKPATCTASEFREKWRSYDWENKINVSVTKKTLRQYLRYIAKQLNMNLLDPLPVSTIEEMSSEDEDEDDISEDKLNANVNHNEIENKDAKGNQDANYNSKKEGKDKEEEEEEEEEERCEYVSTNLYARTIFGEDALANVSVERDSKGTITGIIRIRSNTQSVAYGIGEKINLLSKEKQI